MVQINTMTLSTDEKNQTDTNTHTNTQELASTGPTVAWVIVEVVDNFFFPRNVKTDASNAPQLPRHDRVLRNLPIARQFCHALFCSLFSDVVVLCPFWGTLVVSVDPHAPPVQAHTHAHTHIHGQRERERERDAASIAVTPSLPSRLPASVKHN